MAQPTQSDVHIDVPLTQISTAYIQSADNFVASKVFPIIPVDKQSNKYYVFDKNAWFRDEAQRRADASESEGSGYTLSSDNYNCDVWAFHKDIGSQARANADQPLDPDREATEFVTQRMLVRMERQWVSDYFGTGIWTTDVTPSTLWSDYSGSDPINDIETGKETILSTTGMEPNTLVMGYQVWRQIKNHPDFIGRISESATRIVTPQLVANILEVDRILIAKAIYATNNEGGTAAYAFTHGKHALLCYVEPNPGILKPSAGYMFAWKGVSGGLGTTVGISRFYIPEKKADRVEGEIGFDDKVVGTDLGYFFNGAVA